MSDKVISVIFNNESVVVHKVVGNIYSFVGDVDVTDGYHSMHDLYKHRMALNIALFHAWRDRPAYGFRVVKSLLHNDGTMFEGYFVVMAITPAGQISYHYKMEHWDKFHIEVVDKAFSYDGHTANDVVERLGKL